MKFRFDTKIYYVDNKFLLSLIFFNKTIFKVALHFLIIVVILFNTFFYPEINFIPKIDSKTCTYKTLKKIIKHGRNFSKTFGNLFLQIYY